MEEGFKNNNNIQKTIMLEGVSGADSGGSLEIPLRQQGVILTLLLQHKVLCAQCLSGSPLLPGSVSPQSQKKASRLYALPGVLPE